MCAEYIPQKREEHLGLEEIASPIDRNRVAGKLKKDCSVLEVNRVCGPIKMGLLDLADFCEHSIPESICFRHHLFLEIKAITCFK